MQDNKRLLERPFRYYFCRDPRNFGFGVIALLLTNLTDIIPPLLIGAAIDQIAQNAGISEIGETLGALLVVSLFLSLFRYLWRIYWGKFHQQVADHLGLSD